MGKSVAIAMLSVCLLAGGCAGLSPTEQRVVTGGAVGAATGAGIGALSGSTVTGAAIGTGAGLLGGYLYDQYRRNPDRYRD